MLWHAYVDESGDRGWRPRPPGTPVGVRAGSSKVFSMTAVLVPDGAQPAALRSWDRAAREIGRTAGTQVHWRNVSSPGQRKHVLSAAAGIPDVQTISVVLSKWHLPNVKRLTDPQYLYHWTLRLLVERLSWFGHGRGDVVSMTFAQVKGLHPVLVRSYLRKLRQMDTYIRWRSLRLPPVFDTPANRRMLQVADTFSGGVFAAFEPDAYGFTDQSYLEILKPTIWRRRHRELWQDGLKLGPWPDEECALAYSWFDAFCS